MSFGAGLGGAMQSIGSGTRKLREDQRKSISYGGPEDQFEIATDANGNRTIRQVPEFAAAIEAKRKAAKAPGPKDNLDFRGRAVYAINQLPAKERAAAYQDLMAHPDQYGIDVEGMPSQWSDRYGEIAGTMGMNVPMAITNDRNNADTASTIQDRKSRQGLGERRLEQGERRLRQSPPSTRRGKTNPNADLDYF
jgi:hypothetical protein